MRHILSTEFRIDFVGHLEDLLRERVLLGVGLTAQQSLRPLAYRCFSSLFFKICFLLTFEKKIYTQSTVADLVHHVRGDLALTQLERVVAVYALNLHDSTLPMNIQSVSAKLLLNLVDVIAQRAIAETQLYAPTPTPTPTRDGPPPKEVVCVGR